MADNIKRDFESTHKHLIELAHMDDSFDILYKVFHVGDRRACFYFVDSFTKSDVMERILDFLLGVAPGDVPDNMHDFAKLCMPFGDTDYAADDKAFIKMLLSGMTCMMVEGYEHILTIDLRQYPGRSVEEPERDKSIRGSRDGFVESVVSNVALIRRRIRDVNLCMEVYEVGHISKTDVVVSYMADRVDKKILDELVKRLNAINIDSLTMNQQSLVECIYEHKWINPFPKFKFSERPDTTAACLLEGNIIVLVDNAPSAIIIPISIFDIIEDADDYYFPPVTGTYLRLSRLLCNLIAVFLTPTFLLLVNHPEWVPDWLAFTAIKEEIYVPIFLQFLILEFAIDGLKLASVNTPSMLNTPLSVVAGIVMGDYAVSSGWFNAEIMLYMAFVAISNYTHSNFELGYALKFVRLVMLILTQFFGLWGYIGGFLLCLIATVCNKTFAGKSYIYPLIPFKWSKLKRRLFRPSLPKNEGVR